MIMCLTLWRLAIMFPCQHLGVAPEEGEYSQHKISDPAYKTPLHFRLALRLQNGGRMRDTTVLFQTLQVIQSQWMLAKVTGSPTGG